MKKTILEGLDRAARAGRVLTFLDEDQRPRAVPFTDLAAGSDEQARALIGRHGVSAGDRVCFLGETTPALLCALLATWRAGAITVVLPLQRRSVPPDVVLGEVERRMSAAHSALLIAAPPFDQALSGRLRGREVVSLGELRDYPAITLPAPPVPGDLALLQFTSGTTAAARGVPVTHGQLAGNPDAVYQMVGVGPGDVYVSWLPLYHDMGIISWAGAISTGLNLCMTGTGTFVRDPGVWMRAVSAYRGNMTAGPNFAYGLAARLLALGTSGLDLSSLRCAVSGSEAVDPATVRGFTSLGRAHGLRSEALCPMYGLAEATLDVTVTDPGSQVTCVSAERDSLDPGRTVRHSQEDSGRELVSCGIPLPGTQVVITDEEGHQLPAGTVGEIRVTGPGVVPGYWTPDGSPHPRPVRDPQGRLMTGDIGFFDAGELYICGRQKDMIVTGGRNLYAEDYEAVAEQVPGIRRGNVIAFSIPGSERMVVVAETPMQAERAQRLGGELLATLRAELSHCPHEAVLVRPGTLPKTSSGKRRRQSCRALYEHGELDILAVASRRATETGSAPC
jgi:fatty-acyl-CoA synthase